MNIRSVGSGEDSSARNLAPHGCCMHILLACPDAQTRVGSAMAPVDKPFSTPPPMQLTSIPLQDLREKDCVEFLQTF